MDVVRVGAPMDRTKGVTMFMVVAGVGIRWLSSFRTESDGLMLPKHMIGAGSKGIASQPPRPCKQQKPDRIKSWTQ